MINISPFTTARFEYEDKHLYYLPPGLLEKIESFVPKYLIGSRGTGKTTFLKALWWKERSTNNWLIDALPDSDVFKRFIGIYIKLPTIQINTFCIWRAQSESKNYHLYFSYYLELLVCEQLIEAIIQLSIDSKLYLSVNEEKKLCSELKYDYTLGIFNGLNKESEYTLRQIQKNIWEVHRGLIYNIRANVSEDYLNEKYHINNYGYFLKQFVSHIFSLRQYKGKTLKICFDECECLDDEQLLLINTLLRTAETPITYVAAFVSKPKDINTTLVNKLMLQKADREILVLEDIFNDINSFRNFADGVASLRIKKASSNKVQSFCSENLLGSLNINKILQERLKRSESPEARELIQRAENFASNNFYIDQKTKQEIDDDTLPIYQAYLYHVLKLKIPEIDTPKWEKRSQESREIRKKMVGAYLSILTTFKMDIWYSYSDMLFQLCDSCLRDYLWQMNELFKIMDCSIHDFTKKKISEKKQNEAFKNASKQKRDSIIVQDKIKSPERTERLIDGLAQITHNIQCSSNNNQHLRSSERGIFKISSFSFISSEYREIFRLIEEANEAGFLKILSRTENDIRFRVHTSLAPYYEFSYRGAYYDTPINIGDMKVIIEEENPERRESIIKKISQYTPDIVDLNLSLFDVPE